MCDEDKYYSIYEILRDNKDLIIESGIAVINEHGFTYIASVNKNTPEGYISLMDKQLNKTSINKYCSNFRLYSPF